MSASASHPDLGVSRERDLYDLYFSGAKLRGDDFTVEEIGEWYKSEENSGYIEAIEQNGGHFYSHRALDHHNFYSRVKFPENAKLIGLGAADGSDYVEIGPSIGEYHIVEMAEEYWTDTLFGRPAVYKKPTVVGTLDYPDNTFDVATAYSVLHHIPNVTFVMSELYRVLKPGGILLTREPIISMGDWRQARRGITQNERGLPLSFFRETPRRLGFQTVRESLCVFSVVRSLGDRTSTRPYNSGLVTNIDAALSGLFAWNIRYHPRGFLERLTPQYLALILKK